MELKDLLSGVAAELEDKVARAQLGVLFEGRGGGGALVEFSVVFVRAAAEVARYVAAAAARADATRELRDYAAVLSDVWSRPSGAIAGREGMTNRIESAYFTLRSFLMLASPTTPAWREAKAHGEAVLQAMASYLGQATAARLDKDVEVALGSQRITRAVPERKRGPRPVTVWRHIAQIPVPPDLRLDEALRSGDVGFREGAGGERLTGAVPVWKPEDAHLYEVWFGTNREPVDPADPSRGFANERDPNGTVHYGTCNVEIPRAHKFGSVGTPFWKRWLRLKFTDDHLKLRKIASLASQGKFLAALGEELAAQSKTDRAVLVYLHGYNTSFEEAALRAGQIGFDLKVPGATAFYSWPSKGDATAYPADIARVEASERQIADFLTAVATQAGAHRVHVIAHSMGNRGFARAVSRITSHAAATSGVRFGQIILAAPDLDVDLFKQLAVAYPLISERTTMYVSAKDKALVMSSWLQDSDRAGFTPPVTVLDGIDTVEVTSIDVTILGHGYFAEAEPVLYDIKELLDASTPPDRRLRIEPKLQAGVRFWTIRA